MKKAIRGKFDGLAHLHRQLLCKLYRIRKWKQLFQKLQSQQTQYQATDLWIFKYWTLLFLT